MKALKTVCITMAILLCPVLSGAQSASYAMTFLGLPRDAAALGAGGTFAASPSLAWSTLYNPAYSAFAPEANHLSITAGMWQPGSASCVNSFNVAAAGNLSDRFGFGFAFSPDFGHTYSVMDASGAALGEFSPGNISFAAAGSWRFLPWMSVGAGMKYVRQDLAPEVASQAFCASVFAYARPSGDLSVTAGADNLAFGADSRYPFPSALVAGVNYVKALAEDHRLSGSAECRYFLTGPFGASAGLTYTWKELLHASAGYNWCQAAGPYASYAAFGLGASFLNIQIDAAYVLSPGTPAGNSIFVTIGYKLPGIKDIPTTTEE